MDLKDLIMKQMTWNRKHRIIDNSDIGVVEGSEGISLYLKTKTSASEASTASSAISYLAKITGGTTIAGYTIDIYGDGYDSAVTATGLCEALPLAAASNITVGYPIVVYASNVTLTGGTD
jgi:hypothetical protein